MTIALPLALILAPAAPPGVVVYLVDDLGWADAGCYGNRFNRTPRLDALAREGARFAEAYSAGPVCSPTRAALATGLYPARLGMTAHIPGHWRPFERLVEPPNATRLPADVPTLAERLAAAGYRTGYFGKWHLGGLPGERGFAESFEWNAHAIEGRRAADDLAGRACRFVEASAGRPFFVQLSPSAVHIPLDTTPELLAKYRAAPRVPGYPCDPRYAGLLEEADAALGRVLDTLGRAGRAADTLVIVTSDNGGLEREMGGWPATRNAPLRAEKGTLYEGGVRVPLVVRWPGVARPGATPDGPVLTTDLTATVLKAAGLAPPPRPDGDDLAPRLRGEPAKPRTLFWHYPHYHHSRPCAAARRGNRKLVLYDDNGSAELFDLRADPGESRDLSRERPAEVADLSRELAAWRLSVSAQMPRPNPAFDPKRAGEWWDRATVRPTAAPGFYREGP